MTSLDGLSIFERGDLPRWVKVRQTLDDTTVPDIAAAVAAEFNRPGVGETITPGMTVALTAGSRGIHAIDQILKATVDEVKRRGATPFIVPAMGSHGGATVEGQLSILEHYNITPESMGCEIRASMETVHLGFVEETVPVYFDKTAYEQADAVIPIGRVKPHTDFVGPVESGLMKMIAIGLGKQKGAEYFHARGFKVFDHLIPAVGKFSLTKVNMPFGIATVENGYSKCSHIEAVPAATMYDRETELLVIARERLGRLPGQELDVLIVDEIGKDISGDGADPNVVNRDVIGVVDREKLGFKPTIQRMIFRDLTPDTEGNATGVGMADIVLQQLADKFDPVKTYMNVITSKGPVGGKMPIIANNDRQALYFALACCLDTEVETARIARIRSTKYVEDLWVSEPFLDQVLSSGRVEVVNEPGPILFDDSGMFIENW
ncbi:MAG: lactate racemase domain-containing protein [Chloroflexota bacterium]|nr:lactate racemase domain-containing protein [Chloroflexota bacterium]